MEENELFEDLHVDNDQTDDVPEKPAKVRKTATISKGFATICPQK